MTNQPKYGGNEGAPRVDGAPFVNLERETHIKGPILMFHQYSDGNGGVEILNPQEVDEHGKSIVDHFF
ncbi:hypothetical protein GF357_03715 [Candidatus Dojkabacteria bacterium]|nr:hypothetical protein [Candidatus Dojkabacteria bacterium]